MACEIMNKTKVPYVFFILCTLLLKVSWCQILEEKNVTDVEYKRNPIMSRLSHIMDKPTKYSWLVDLYDHRGWMKRHFDEVSSNCSKEMESYLEALRSEEEWAIRMFDASGRYNGQFFFGNDFWLGSYRLCQEMDDERFHPQNIEKTPPFSVKFNVAKVHLAIHNYTLQARNLMIGECLPDSCTIDDVHSIMKSGAKIALHEDASSPEHVILNVIYVKRVPGSYNMWEDVKFFIVGGVGLAFVLLMLVATFYESYINMQNAENNRSEDIEIEYKNNNYTRGSTDVFANGKSSQVRESVEICESANENRRKQLGTDTMSRILLSFSMISNTQKIMSTEDSAEDSVSCIHGLRFLSLAWVIMVHTYLQVFTIADNKTLRIITERNFFYQTVGNASFSVDTFFFISGFLITFLYFKSMDARNDAAIKRKARQDATNGGKIQTANQFAFTNPVSPQQDRNGSNCDDSTVFPTTQFTRRTCSKEIKANVNEFAILMFYRVVRLTPAYLFVIGVNELGFKYSHNNGVFELNIFDHENCARNWWRNVLYINNMFPQVEMCMLWSWYMANDTQFYVVGAILLLLSKRYFKTSTLIFFVLLVSSWIVTAYISLLYNYRAKIQEPFEMFDLLYDKPWSRIGPYFVGMATGWYAHRCKGNVILPWWLNLIGWPSALAIVSSLIYGMKDGSLEQWPTAFYVSIGHTAWGVAMAWIVLYCISNKNGVLNKLLSYRGILPLSRLAYCAYLVHPTIMVICSYQLDGPFHLHNGIVLVIYAGNAVMSFLMAFAISLAFEAPIVRLLKINKSKKD